MVRVRPFLTLHRNRNPSPKPIPTRNQVNTLNPVWDYTMIFRQQGLPVR